MTSRRSVLHFPSPIKWSSARIGAAACETWAVNKIRQGRLGVEGNRPSPRMVGTGGRQGLTVAATWPASAIPDLAARTPQAVTPQGQQHS